MQLKGTTPLMAACIAGHVDCVEELLDGWNVSVNEQDEVVSPDDWTRDLELTMVRTGGEVSSVLRCKRKPRPDSLFSTIKI